MPLERWGPSWRLRLLGAVQLIFYVGLGGVLMWFFFPHALLVPVMAVFVALCLCSLIVPYQVVQTGRPCASTVSKRINS